MALKLRELSEEEQTAINKLSRSRTTSARLVERARIIELAKQGLRVPDIATELKISSKTARKWLKRFNADGLNALQDNERSGRPAIYSVDEVAEVIAASLVKPQSLGLPFGSWTIDRLATYLNEEKGISIKRSRISELLIAEGLRWRTQEDWFGERVDPQFAEKRGESKSFTVNRLLVVG